MERNDFISDQLGNIRDRLRENYQGKNREAVNPDPLPGTAPADVPAEREIKCPEHAPETVEPRISEAQERRRAELRGVGRDLAARLTGGESECARRLRELETEREALDAYRRGLGTLAEKFSGLDDSAPDYGRKLENLRLEYFQLQGSIRKRENGAAAMPASPLAEYLTLGVFQRFGLAVTALAPVWLAILISSLIVAGVMFAVF